MERHRTTLSFLTESKTSAAEFSSMRRVAMTLLVMFLLTATGAWAQESSDVTTTVESEDIEESFSLNYTIINENPRQVKVSGYEGDEPQTLNIPATAIINGNSYSVTSIGSSAFYGCVSLKSVTIPNSVTSIGSSAFSECICLDYVEIGNSVTSIGESAFESCSSLEYITIPDGVTNIGDYAFSECSGLLSVTIGNSVTSIGDFAFYRCPDLDPVTIPNSVTSIGSFAFYECSCFDYITIPNSVTSIGNYAFANCEELKSITLNSNPKIGANAFLKTPATVTMNLTASDINGDKWTTFYNNGYNFQTDDNTTVYKGTVDGSFLVLTEVEDRIVNSGIAVILKSTDNPIVMTLTDSESSDTNDNDLRGISDRTLRTDVIANISDADAIYTMGNTQAGFGFHRYTGNYVPAGKAFLPLNTNNGAKAQSLTMVFGNVTTEVSELQITNDKLPVDQSSIYDLNGRKVSENNLKPGIYVKNGKKFVVK